MWMSQVVCRLDTVVGRTAALQQAWWAQSMVMGTRDWAVGGKAGTRRDVESRENCYSPWE